MTNGKHFFSIHHNDWGLLFSYTYYSQYIHKCVVKYLRILFLYSGHTNTRWQICFIFPTKTMYSVHPNQHKVDTIIWFTYKTTEEFTVHSYSKKKQKKKIAACSPLFQSGHSTSSSSQAMFSLTKQQEKYHLAWWIQPWKAPTAIYPHASSIAWRRGIHICGFRSYTLHLQAEKNNSQ